MAVAYPEIARHTETRQRMQLCNLNTGESGPLVRFRRTSKERKMGAVVNEYCAITPNVKLGSGVKLSKFINLYGCEIGDNTKIGAFVEIQKNATVGKELQDLQPHIRLRGRHD